MLIWTFDLIYSFIHRIGHIGLSLQQGEWLRVHRQDMVIDFGHAALGKRTVPRVHMGRIYSN